MEPWKLEKIKAIANEVAVFHPLLREIFNADPSISNFEYTHGQNEMGADFVLARTDPTLGDESYIGVIVKCGSIKQDHGDVKRQIEECQVERFFAGGKAKIYLSEIWIIFNGSISNGAQRKIHEDYKAKNIKFIDADKLCKLVERHAPHYWNEVTHEMGNYLRETLASITKIDSFSSISIPGSTLEIESELYEIARKTEKTLRFKKSRYTTFEKAIEVNRFLVIEGGMGAGKSTMFRKYAKKLCDPTIFQQRKIVPKIIHFREISESPATQLAAAINTLRQLASAAKPEKYTIFIDGIDEVKETSEFSTIHKIKEISACAQQFDDVTIILGSRPTWTIEEGEQILKQGARYQILPLSLDQIYKVVQHNCAAMRISDRLRGDLAKSSLLRVLPRTPLSAILLAKVLSANPKEIPQTLPELYSKYVELTLGRWDVEKGLMTEREFPVVLSMLSKVAKYMLENELPTLSASEVIQMFNEYTKTRQGLPSANELFENLARRSELVNVNKENNTFSFRHKSFSEYLLALHQKEHFGKSAPLSNPFEGYWLGVEYFYLGLIQDAGLRIDKLSSIQLPGEREKVLRLLNFGNLMLAAYQTEYSHIEKAVFQVFIEITNHFLKVRSGEEESMLESIPELHFFCTLCFSLKDSFEYDYFRKALTTAQLTAQCDTSLNDEQRITLSFLIDSVRAGLKESDVFEFITSQDLAVIPWAVKLGIKHVSEDEKINVGHVNTLVKKIVRSQRGNINLQSYIHTLYTGSMKNPLPLSIKAPN